MKIEKYLVLNKYLLSLFGVNHFISLQEKLKDVRVGVDNDGRSYFIRVLQGFKNKIISEDDLLRYDENIQSHIKKINFRREPVFLKYFQYLAVLFTEIVLDNLKHKKVEFIHSLNEFFRTYKQAESIKIINEFTEEDLNKLAFWMATGSGKTLIAHINYYQFFHYKPFSPDNILFITPNEGLSKQHVAELKKSGIPSFVYTGSLSSGFRDEREVLVIEITKLVEEKKGSGITLPITVFEGKNLLFVDEGHKGKKSDEQTWTKLRNKLSQNGFAFEYSATFGQILSEKQKEILAEYAKSIIFDYSYKYFYLDGYGKDFSVLNVKSSVSTALGSSEFQDEFQEIMFVANLLSFYEQLLVYEEHEHLAKEYNIEKPLWIFVGATVTGQSADVVEIIELIRKTIKDGNWAKHWINKILQGSTHLKDEEDKDVFQHSFRYIRNRGSVNAEALYEDICKRVFGGKGNFKIYEIKNAPGEFGLKIGENNYFGVINIGDVSEFKKALKDNNIEVDVISDSLFDDIKKEKSPINILIGSKKFIEGWDTWRVSSMGLLNIGKEQGPQIIQLFGRGVRLKGKGMSLKRSGANLQIQLLEALNVYGIKANYLNTFLEAIRKEEVEWETIQIPIKPQHQEKWQELYMLTKDEQKTFEEEKILRLNLDEKLYININLLPRVSKYAKDKKQEKNEVVSIQATEITAEIEPRVFPSELASLLDWDRIWQEITEYKILMGYWNLVFSKEILKKVLLSSNCKIQISPDVFNVTTQQNLRRLEDLAILVIKKYVEKFYQKRAKEFETQHLKYEFLENQKDRLLSPFIESENKKCYVIQVEKKNKDLIEKIKELASNLREQSNGQNNELLQVYFDKHLFLPVLIKSKGIDKMKPDGLVESEINFIEGLKNYLQNNQRKLSGYDIYLMRNFPKSGRGFMLQWSEFYPDFIMWMKKCEKQLIVFIEPHGLMYSKGLDDEKIRFAGGIASDGITIKKIEQEINQKEKKHLTLEYFLLSQTPYEELVKGTVQSHSQATKEEYEANHVLFLDDGTWANKLFEKLL